MAIKKTFSYPFTGTWSDADVSTLCLDTGSWSTSRQVMNRESVLIVDMCGILPSQCIINKGDHFETT
jgi:hypothetical protein